MKIQTRNTPLIEFILEHTSQDALRYHRNVPHPLVRILDGGDAVRQFDHRYRQLDAMALPVVRVEVGSVIVGSRPAAGGVLYLTDVGPRLDVVVDQVVPQHRLLDARLVTAFVGTGERLFLHEWKFTMNLIKPL